MGNVRMGKGDAMSGNGNAQRDTQEKLAEQRLAHSLRMAETAITSSLLPALRAAQKAASALPPQTAEDRLCQWRVAVTGLFRLMVQMAMEETARVEGILKALLPAPRQTPPPREDDSPDRPLERIKKITPSLIELSQTAAEIRGTRPISQVSELSERVYDTEKDIPEHSP